MRKKQIIFSADSVYINKTHKNKYSIAVEGTKIIESGKREVIKEQFPYAKEIKFDGTLYPGFIDSHLHLNQIALLLSSINAQDFSTIKQLKETILGDKNNITYIYNMDFNKLTDDDFAKLFNLPHPVFMQSIDEHSVFVNNALIKEKNVSLKEISGGEIVQLNGKFTGILKDNAIKNVESIINRTADEKELNKAEELLLKNGIVGVTNFDYSIFSKLNSRNNKIRIFQGIKSDNLDKAIRTGLKTGQGNEYFRIGPVKCFLDGSLGSQTALMKEENLLKGLLTLSEERFREIVEKANKNNLQVAVHAIGSRAVEIALKTFKEKGMPEMRNRIEHLQFINENDIGLLKETEFIASMQPLHFKQDKQLLKKYIGEYPYAYAWKTVANTGKIVAFGSDAPVTEPSVIKGIETAISREGEGIKIDDAIIAYTEGGARANFYERAGGRIVRGLNADFALINKAFSEQGKFQNIKVYATIIGGEIRWKM
jgi:predicted amidohydrolase YtcJ